MPPQSNFSLYDAALLVNVALSKPKEPPKKVLVKVTRKKKKIIVKVSKKKDHRCGGVIDFGFVKDKNNDTISFQAGKMQKDIAFIKKEVIWGMFIKPLLGGGKKRQSETRTRPR